MASSLIIYGQDPLLPIFFSDAQEFFEIGVAQGFSDELVVTLVFEANKEFFFNFEKPGDPLYESWHAFFTWAHVNNLRPHWEPIRDVTNNVLMVHLCLMPLQKADAELSFLLDYYS